MTQHADSTAASTGRMCRRRAAAILFAAIAVPCLFVSLLIWRDYRQTQAMIADLKGQGATVATAITGPEWLQLLNFGGAFERIVEIQRSGSLDVLERPDVTSSLGSLERVFVFDCPLKAADGPLLTRFPRLRLVAVTNGTANSEVLAPLVAVTTLKELYLQNCGTADPDLKIIAQMSGLEALAITDSPITDEGLAQLHGLKRLHRLNLAHTGVTAAGVAQLKAALPDCTVFHE